MDLWLIPKNNDIFQHNVYYISCSLNHTCCSSADCSQLKMYLLFCNSVLRLHLPSGQIQM